MNICDQCHQGHINRVTGIGRTATGPDGQSFNIPDDLAIPTCDSCGARMFDTAVIGELAHAESKERNQKDEDNVDRWTAFAMVLGFDELAKSAKTLGEKTFFRMARDAAERGYTRRGGSINRIEQDGEATILVLQDRMPHIIFHARDIELMRTAVAAYDASSTKEPKDA